MNKIALTALAATLALCFPAFADNHGGGNFDTKKANMLKNLDTRIANLQEAKSCAESASDKESLKTCRKTLREKNKGLRMERMDKKMERMKKRKERMMEKGK